MADSRGIELTDWTVEYDLPAGKTMPVAVTIPHAWRQEVDVRWEGPAIYRCAVDLPEDAWLVFEGVSYQARVFVQGEFVGEHRGIWDAFAIDVRKWSGQSVVIRVEVVKNGGGTFPVRDVLSGFLPYVFHTFGGIYKPVWVVSSRSEPLPYGSARGGGVGEGIGELGLHPQPPPQAPSSHKEEAKSRIRSEGTRLFVDDKPFGARGVLTWGWYPDLGHQNPDWKTIRKEIEAAKELGFNVIKFCLWLPPHEFLEEMDKAGLFAWIELPLWDPSPDPEKLADMRDEIERIILQYRHHSNVIFWTCGCELSDATSADFRRELVEIVKDLTDCPMVKDNSGGAEMYGGDPREFGDFDDFHPYCDLPFYPEVLASLAAKADKPILLGEFNEYDCARDLVKLNHEAQFWVSTDPALNDQGVRWLYDLPRILNSSAGIAASELTKSESERLVQRSIGKSNFIRERVDDSVLAHDAVAGWVLTGWVDTPISTSGFLNENFDLKGIKFPLRQATETTVFPIPLRRPPWVHGGNRPGWQDFFNRWTGPNKIRIGVRDSCDASLQIDWLLRGVGADGAQIGAGGPVLDVIGGISASIDLDVELPFSGEYWLTVHAGEASLRRRIMVFDRIDWTRFDSWSTIDREGFLVGFPDSDGPNILATNWDSTLVDAWRSGANVVLIATEAMTLPMPFWRECIHESIESRPWLSALEEDRWAQILPVSTDRALDQAVLETALGASGNVLLNRIDTRSYVKHPFAMEFENDGANFIVTTLRPFGGLGSCSFGIKNNPAGAHMLARLLKSLQHS